MKKIAAYRYRDDIVCAIVESDTDVERVLRKEFGVRRTPAVIARREVKLFLFTSIFVFVVFLIFQFCVFLAN